MTAVTDWSFVASDKHRHANTVLQLHPHDANLKQDSDTRETMTHLCKKGRRVEQVQEESSYAPVNIHDQVGSLLQGVSFHSKGIVQVFGAGKVLESILLQQLDSLVTVILQSQQMPNQDMKCQPGTFN